MSIDYFANAKFNFGWEIPICLKLFGSNYNIVAVADSYYETDKATDNQNKSYSYFIENYQLILEKTEKLLISVSGTPENAKNRFSPTMIKIKDTGDCGIVFDDNKNFENGVVVTIVPEFSISDTDSYF